MRTAAESLFLRQTTLHPVSWKFNDAWLQSNPAALPLVMFVPQWDRCQKPPSTPHESKIVCQLISFLPSFLRRTRGRTGDGQALLSDQSIADSSMEDVPWGVRLFRSLLPIGKWHLDQRVAILLVSLWRGGIFSPVGSSSKLLYFSRAVAKRNSDLLFCTKSNI